MYKEKLSPLNNVKRWCLCSGLRYGGVPKIRISLPRCNDHSGVLVGQNVCRLLAYAIDRIEDRSVFRKRGAETNGEGKVKFRTSYYQI